MSNPYTENVKRGSVALTAHFGDDRWKDRIDIDRLNMVDSRDCILGQLFGWGYGAENHPFDDLDTDLGFYNDEKQHDILRDAWLEELAR